MYEPQKKKKKKLNKATTQKQKQKTCQYKKLQTPVRIKHLFIGFNCHLLYLWAVSGVKKVSASLRIHLSNSQFHSMRPAKGEGTLLPTQ